jgi:hypothetical protein
VCRVRVCLSLPPILNEDCVSVCVWTDGRTDGGRRRRRNVQSHKAIQESLNNAGKLLLIAQLIRYT